MWSTKLKLRILLSGMRCKWVEQIHTSGPAPRKKGLPDIVVSSCSHIQHIVGKGGRKTLCLSQQDERNVEDERHNELDP
jgi:hypothetical protein